MVSIKENSIREYISNIDFKRDDWGLTQIKEDMRKFLGEEPGIDVVYKKDVMINEVTGDAHEFKGIKSVSIIFFDTDDKFKKLEFLIDDNV
jgi:hypothetical protein